MKRRSICWSLILLPLSAGVVLANEGPASLYESSLAAAEAGRTKLAQQGLERLIRYYPHHVFGRRAYLDLAQLHLQERRPELALRVLQEASASPHANAALRASCQAWRATIKTPQSPERPGPRRTASQPRPGAKAPIKLSRSSRADGSRLMPRVGLTVGQIKALERVLDRREEDLEKAVIDGDEKDIERFSNIISRLEQRLVKMLNDFDPQKAARPARDTREDPELVRLNRALQAAFDALSEAHEKGDADKIARSSHEVARLEAALGVMAQDSDGMSRDDYPRDLAIERAASAAEISRLEETIDKKLDAFDEAHNAGKLENAQALHREIAELERQLHRVLEGGWSLSQDEEDRAERKARAEAERQASRRLGELEDRIERQRAALEDAVERGETKRLEVLERQLEELEDQVEALLEGRGKPIPSAPKAAPAPTIAPKAPPAKAEARPAARQGLAPSPEDDEELREVIEDMRAEAKTLREAGELELAAEVEREMKEMSKLAQPRAPTAPAPAAPPARLRPLPPRNGAGLEDRLARVERGLEAMNARLEELLKRLDPRRL